VTTTGNASLFHGVPDWAYEEEVLSSDSALWWSPTSQKVAFLSLDETRVNTFTYPVYNSGSDSHSIVPYPTDILMKYPKPGYDNPIVSVQVFDMGTGHLDTLDWEGKGDPEDSIVQEVAWVGAEALLIKEVNRNADNGRVVYFDLDSSKAVKGKIVRKLGKAGEEGDDGWIESVRFISISVY
jgi:dipeptidyl aminopeptidase B